MIRLTSFFLIMAIMLSDSGLAQQSAALTKQQEKLRTKAHSLNPDASISIQGIHSQEEFGTYVSSNDQAITFFDIDSKTNVTLAFANLQILKSGYGGYNSFQKKHTDHTKAVVIVLVVAGGLAALIAAAAAAK